MSSQKGADETQKAAKKTGRALILTSATNYNSVEQEIVADEVDDDETEDTPPTATAFDPNEPVKGIFIAPTPTESTAVSHTSYPTTPPETPDTSSDGLPPGCEGLFCVNPNCKCDPSIKE